MGKGLRSAVKAMYEWIKKYDMKSMRANVSKVTFGAGQFKIERKTVSREQRETEKQRWFELKQQKKKEKHRGR